MDVGNLLRGAWRVKYLHGSVNIFLYTHICIYIYAFACDISEQLKKVSIKLIYYLFVIHVYTYTYIHICPTYFIPLGLYDRVSKPHGLG